LEEIEQRLQPPAELIFAAMGFLGIVSAGMVKENMAIVLHGGARVEFTAGETRRWRDLV
jgi:hypothetical protein